MKKTMVAIAALASTAAFAQVTLSGTFGAGYQSYPSAATTGTVSALPTSGSVPTTAPTLGAVAAAAATNRGLIMTDGSIKFSASEDLGGGMTARGNAQIAVSGVRGGGVTKEDSDVSLSGGFGTLAIINSRNGNRAIGANVASIATPRVNWYDTIDSRGGNDILAYTTPQLAPGFTLTLMSAETTDASAATAPVKVTVVSASYAAGALSAGLDIKTGPSAFYNRSEGFVTYDFGAAKVGVGYGTKDSASGKAVTSLGLSVPVGAMTVGLNQAKRGTKSFIDYGFSYNMSKTAAFNVGLSDVTGTAYAGNHYRVNVVKKF